MKNLRKIFHDFYFGIKAEKPKPKKVEEETEPKKVEVKPDPKPGDLYCFTGDKKNPFIYQQTIKIKDVKDGYVLYYINRIFNNESTTIELFLNMYEPKI
jgi:hypothetical protein